MSEQKNIPELRFPEFNGEWVKKKVGNITEKVGSGSTPLGGSKSYQSEGIIFIRSQNVNNDKLNLNDVVFITERTNEKMSGSKVYADDILLNITGASIGRSCIVPRDFQIGNVNQHVCIIRLTQGYNPYFLQPFLSSYKGQKLVFQEQAGGGREGLNFQSIRGFKIFVPSFPEQQKIASFFTAIDHKISQLKKKKSLLEQYKKGVMQKIFSQEIRFRDDNGQEFPKWEKKSLGEMGHTYNGLTGKSKEDFGSGMPYIKYKQIFDDSKIDVNRFDFVKIENGEKQNKVEYGDMFFTTSSETPDEIGTASVMLDEVDELYLNSFCFGFRSPSIQLNPHFSRYLFRNEMFRKDIIKLAQGSTRYNMSKVELMKLKVDLPSIQEQTKIANFLSAIDTKINHTQSQIEKVELWKKGLLQKMFV